MPRVHYYKYRSLSNLRFFLDILIYKRLYMASYSELNDPMEGAFVITGDHRNIDNSWLEILRSEKNDLRICSLSRSFNNILMWAHYADSNNGCCIECEVVSSPDIVEEISVDYVPHVEPVAHLDPPQAAKQILSRKLECWKYEDEVRFLKHVPKDSNKIKFIKIKIHRVYLGIKLSKTDLTFYTNLIHSIDDSIEVVRMRKDDLSY